jgi:hypothetical protein
MASGNDTKKCVFHVSGSKVAYNETEFYYGQSMKVVSHLSKKVYNLPLYQMYAVVIMSNVIVLTHLFQNKKYMLQNQPHRKRLTEMESKAIMTKHTSHSGIFSTLLCLFLE